MEAALRETSEEAGVDPTDVDVVREVVDDHGGWSYTTVVAVTDRLLPVTALDGESLALAWVPLPEVCERDLHPGFGLSWPGHLAALA